jgi:hypothetical protein
MLFYEKIKGIGTPDEYFLRPILAQYVFPLLVKIFRMPGRGEKANIKIPRIVPEAAS